MQAWMARDLTEANLTDATLNDGHLRNTKLDGADFTRASLDGTRLQGANLENSLFENAELNGAYLMEVDARGANFADADLTDANLTDANLEKADLTGATLSRTNLTNANISGALLQDIESIEGADLSDVTFDESVAGLLHVGGKDNFAPNLHVLQDAKLRGGLDDYLMDKYDEEFREYYGVGNDDDDDDFTTGPVVVSDPTPDSPLDSGEVVPDFTMYAPPSEPAEQQPSQPAYRLPNTPAMPKVPQAKAPRRKAVKPPYLSRRETKIGKRRRR